MLDRLIGLITKSASRGMGQAKFCGTIGCATPIVGQAIRKTCISRGPKTSRFSSKVESDSNNKECFMSEFPTVAVILGETPYMLVGQKVRCHVLNRSSLDPLISQESSVIPIANMSYNSNIKKCMCISRDLNLKPWPKLGWVRLLLAKPSNS